MKRIIECVPNFSEGRNPDVIRQITQQIESVDGVRLLNVDPGKATNRTVVTFVGEPEAVLEAAFQAICKAGELIDMSQHTGEHPRMGATDVCPLIPISGISMEETAEYARQLAQRVAEALNLPVYLYEAAQADPNRKNLSVIRSGEYEGFFKKIQLPEWKPDFGPAEMDVKRGATVIGARDFLIAYNVNLNTTSTRRANAVAFDVREAGRVLRENGQIKKDAAGNPLSIPGLLKSVKAIGWFIEEYGIAQISMNLTNMRVTPLHVAFDAVRERARERGMRVTGSELVGLVPLQALTEAGKYFLRKQQRSVGVSEQALIDMAIRSMGLDALTPFKPEERVIEYLLQDPAEQKLIRQSLSRFAEETASESPAPGGGSISAYVGTLGVSLATMVANLSAHKKGWDDRWLEFSNWAEKGEALRQQLLALVDADTRAFDAIMAAFGLPKSNEAAKRTRQDAIQSATKIAMEVPLQVMRYALQTMEIIEAMASIGNPNSVSDAGVGALCARTAVLGAFLNVRINAAGCTDAQYVQSILADGAAMEKEAMESERRILSIVDQQIASLG